MTVAENMPNMLIVDDETEITDLINKYLKSQRTNLIPIATNNPRDVLPILDRHKGIRVILSDVNMPAINGLDLLMQVKGKYPNMQFLIMTGYSTLQLKLEVFRRGAIRYIEKPLELDVLRDYLLDAMEDHGKGFEGKFVEVQLSDIIQLIGLSRRSVALNVGAGQRRGTLYFVDGEIVHAICGDRLGEEAFYEICSWPSGQFSLGDIALVGQEHTITRPWQGLLLEAARRQDESSSDAMASEEIEEDEETMRLRLQESLYKGDEEGV